MNINSYIIFQQQPSGNIRYQTDSNPDNQYAKFDDFFKYINGFVVLDMKGIIEMTNRFKQILLFPMTGKWQIVNEEVNKDDYTFEELMKSNGVENKVLNKDDEVRKESFFKKLQTKGYNEKNKINDYIKNFNKKNSKMKFKQANEKNRFRI